MKKVSLFFLLFASQFSFGQFRNNIWCFGDSAGIDFNIAGNPVVRFSKMDGRGSCVSIADTSGSLLFYAYTKADVTGGATFVRSANDSIMVNGDSLVGEGWYHELVVIPIPGNSSLYYLFSIGVTDQNQPGLYYSIVDMSLNGGQGDVAQRNVQLLNQNMCDGLQAIKHGNGRDWWLFCHPADTVNNIYYRFLITPAGIQGPDTKNWGALTNTNILNINFSNLGNKVAILTYADLLEIYDFDRCTGDFNNLRTIHAPSTSPPFSRLWSCEFSPDDNILYVGTDDSDSYLLQINILDLNPWASRDTLWFQDSIKYTGGQLEIGPDEKIYYTSSWYDGLHFNYPYNDSSYFPENMNLGVVNSPNDLGSACDFQPYSFYLGGKRTYIGLPNNPNYDLQADPQSLCDSLSAVSEADGFTKSQLNIFYHSNWQTVFINGEGLEGKNYNLYISDISGKEVFSENGLLTSQYYVRAIHCEKLSSGIYMVLFETEKERLIKKMVIE